MTQDRLHVIMTGGTIDSKWTGPKDTIVPLGSSVMPRFLRDELRLPYEMTFDQVCMKDSREIQFEDRLNMLESIRDTDAKNVLVTHGTYTMVTTARFLASRVRDKVVVLTGSFTPAEMPFTDAGFSIATALIGIDQREPGVYVAIQGKVHDPFSVEKNVDKGLFEPTTGDDVITIG